VLVNLDAEFGRDPGQLAREAGRMHQGAVVAGPASGEEDGAGDLGLNGLGVQPGAAGVIAQPWHLMRLHRDAEQTGALELARQSERTDVGLERVEVGPAEPLQLRVLSGPAAAAVLLAVREARLAETTVAPRGGPTDGLSVEQHDAGGRIAPLGEHGGPQAAVSAAHHRQVRLVGADETLVARTGAELIEPEHAVLGRGERVVDHRGTGTATLVDGAMRWHREQRISWRARL
jgi:hypothetical protein